MDAIKQQMQKTIESLQAQIQSLQEQINGETEVYPAKAGECILMPADETGKRLIKIVPNGSLAIANLFALHGVEVYTGEIPACGYIIDDRKTKVYAAALEKPSDEAAQESADAGKTDEKQKMPADFRTNKPTVLDEKGRMSAVTAAILGLKKEDFNKTNGLPAVFALSKITGFDVTGIERDKAWETFKASQPDWEPAE